MKNSLLLSVAAGLAFLAGAILGPPPVAFAASDQGFNGTTAKTAAYTILASECGTVFTNRGDTDGATLTLPAPFANAHYLFLVHAAQTFTIAADAVDTLVTYNDAAADSVASNTVGAAMWVWSDGTSWFLIPCTVGVTYTVNT